MLWTVDNENNEPKKTNKYVNETEILNFKFHDLPIISRQFSLLTLENFYCESLFTEYRLQFAGMCL